MEPCCGIARTAGRRRARRAIFRTAIAIDDPIARCCYLIENNVERFEKLVFADGVFVLLISNSVGADQGCEERV